MKETRTPAWALLSLLIAWIGALATATLALYSILFAVGAANLFELNPSIESLDAARTISACNGNEECITFHARIITISGDTSLVGAFSFARLTTVLAVLVSGGAIAFFAFTKSKILEFEKLPDQTLIALFGRTVPAAVLTRLVLVRPKVRGLPLTPFTDGSTIYLPSESLLIDSTLLSFQLLHELRHVFLFGKYEPLLFAGLQIVAVQTAILLFPLFIMIGSDIGGLSGFIVTLVLTWSSYLYWRYAARNLSTAIEISAD